MSNSGPFKSNAALFHGAPRSRHLQPSSSREIYVINLTGTGLSLLSKTVMDSRYDGVYLDRPRRKVIACHRSIENQSERVRCAHHSCSSRRASLAHFALCVPCAESHRTLHRQANSREPLLSGPVLGHGPESTHLCHARARVVQRIGVRVQTRWPSTFAAARSRCVQTLPAPRPALPPRWAACSGRGIRGRSAPRE